VGVLFSEDEEGKKQLSWKETKCTQAVDWQIYVKFYQLNGDIVSYFFYLSYICTKQEVSQKGDNACVSITNEKTQEHYNHPMYVIARLAYHVIVEW